jgi:prophage tail gpP-like protein
VSGLSLSVEAVRLLDGRAVRLTGIKYLEIGGSLSSPARDFSGVFAVDEFPLEFGSVTVRQGDTVLFNGRVDSQRSVLSDRGRLVHIDARTKGALLLDNEAKPSVLQNVQMATVFALFCQPYGFALYNPQPSRALAAYTVRAGMSEWEALTGFSRRMFGITPYVEGEQVCIDTPRSHTSVRISNTGKGLRYSRLEYQFTPYNIISDVIMRGPEGAYNASVHNSSSRYYGVRRKRYVIPHNEFMDALSLDANQRIRRSMLESQQVNVTLTGMVDLPPGQQVEMVDGELTLYNLLVGDIRWVLDENGLTTRLKLVSSVYYS